MAETPSRLFVLLQAYEELTRKESTCLNEENWDALLETQAKKAKLIDGLQTCPKEFASEDERQDFNARIASLRGVEDANGKALADKMKENRDVSRKLNRKTRSGSKAIRAYGSTGMDKPRSGSLTDRA